MLCDGQESTQEYLRQKLLSIMESVSWVCDDVLENHEWVSKLTVSMPDNVVLLPQNYDIDVPCVVQWGLLWFSSPSRLNQRFADNGTKVAKHPRNWKHGNGATNVFVEIGRCGFVQTDMLAGR